MKEIELAEQVISWLEDQNWEIYQEVKVRSYGGVADIVAVQNNLVWVVECKRSLSLSVLSQASLWRVHFRSVAVPSTKRGSSRSRQLAYQVAREYCKVGIITLDYGRHIVQAVPPPLMREYHRFTKTFRSLLTEDHKTFAKAGSKGGSHWTPYKSTIRACRSFITKNPGCTMRELIDELGRQHYANDKSAISNLRINFQTIENDGCRVDETVKPFRLYIKEPES